MDYTDVMLDLETMSKKSNAAIVSIGAVEFNLDTGETGREFYRVIDLKSCLDLGLTVEASTIYWWLQQSQGARDAICHEPVHLSVVVQEFNNWMQDCIEKVNIWGNAARFDIGKLEDAYVACGYNKNPWYFRSERDVRTLGGFAPDIKANSLFIGNEHNPIDDCKHQIAYCHKIWKKLNGKKEEIQLPRG